MNRRELLRYERGLTATEVCQSANVSRPTLASFERGEMVTAPVAKALADFYGLTVAELLGLDLEAA